MPEYRDASNRLALRLTPGLTLLIALASTFVAGCGGRGYSESTVAGVVKIDGAAVPHGFITFNPTIKDQGPVVGAPIENGAYRCEHVPIGKMNVTFVAQAAEPTIVYERATKSNHEVPKNILPPKYQSGVPAEVNSGENHLDFDLKSE